MADQNGWGNLIQSLSAMQDRKLRYKELAQRVQESKAEQALKEHTQNVAETNTQRLSDQNDRRIELEATRQKAEDANFFFQEYPKLTSALQQGSISPNQFNALLSAHHALNGPNSPVNPQRNTLSFPFSQPQGDSSPALWPSAPEQVPQSSAPPVQKPASPLPQMPGVLPRPNYQSPTSSTQAPPVSSSAPGPLGGLSAPDPATMANMQAARLQQMKGASQAQTEGRVAAEAPQIAQQQTFQSGENQKGRDFEKERDTAKTQAEKDLIDKEETFQAAQNAFKRTQDWDIAHANEATTNRIANMRNSTENRQIGLQYGLDPGMGAAIQQGYFGGNGDKLNEDNPINRHLIAAGESQGLKKPGTDVDELKKLEDINRGDIPVFRDFAQNQLTDTPFGTALQNAAGKQGIIPTDAKKKEDELKKNFQSVGKGLEGYSGSRQLASQFSAESSTMPTLADTKKQGLDKVQSMEDLIHTRRNEMLNNYSPEQRGMMQLNNRNYNFEPTVKIQPPGNHPPEWVKQSDADYLVKRGAKLLPTPGGK